MCSLFVILGRRSSDHAARLEIRRVRSRTYSVPFPAIMTEIQLLHLKMKNVRTDSVVRRALAFARHPQFQSVLASGEEHRSAHLGRSKVSEWSLDIVEAVVHLKIGNVPGQRLVIDVEFRLTAT